MEYLKEDLKKLFSFIKSNVHFILILFIFILSAFLIFIDVPRNEVSIDQVISEFSLSGLSEVKVIDLFGRPGSISIEGDKDGIIKEYIYHINNKILYIGFKDSRVYRWDYK